MHHMQACDLVLGDELGPLDAIDDLGDALLENDWVGLKPQQQQQRIDDGLSDSQHQQHMQIVVQEQVQLEGQEASQLEEEQVQLAGQKHTRLEGQEEAQLEGQPSGQEDVLFEWQEQMPPQQQQTSQSTASRVKGGDNLNSNMAQSQGFEAGDSHARCSHAPHASQANVPTSAERCPVEEPQGGSEHAAVDAPEDTAATPVAVGLDENAAADEGAPVHSPADDVALISEPDFMMTVAGT
jgi:hypothetical protein